MKWKWFKLNKKKSKKKKKKCQSFVHRVRSRFTIIQSIWIHSTRMSSIRDWDSGKLRPVRVAVKIKAMVVFVVGVLILEVFAICCKFFKKVFFYIFCDSLSSQMTTMMATAMIIKENKQIAFFYSTLVDGIKFFDTFIEKICLIMSDEQ